jgi:hypothetical protein
LVPPHVERRVILFAGLAWDAIVVTDRGNDLVFAPHSFARIIRFALDLRELTLHRLCRALLAKEFVFASRLK